MSDLHSKFEIRMARKSDFPQINEWDEFWGDRRQEMQRGEIYVADFRGECLGYLRITRNEFLNYPLIAVVCTKPSYRRTGIALSLIKHIESIFNGLRIFSTTEVTNQEMIALFYKSGFQQSGFIDCLNSDGSRELIFTKQF